jgi:DNA invertase Pin-like site-specific DNA recombinase
MSGKAIAYYRVSTQKQGQSGLGLEAQRAAVEQYAAGRGLTIIDDYTEVETGTSKRARVEIQWAIDAAREAGAVLLIAKLDRLARNVSFVSALMESGVKFTAVDMPDANELTIHIIAAMAQHEATMISERTKAALAAAKRRGVKLGNPENLTDAARAKGNEINQQAAREAYHLLYSTIQLLREKGLSYDHIADWLNAKGHKTRQRKPFQAMTVYRIVQRNGGGD